MSKNRSEIAACEQKNHYRESEFLFEHHFLTLLSNSSEKISLEFEKISPLAFSLYLLFWRDRNHYSNLHSKIMQMYKQILNPIPYTPGLLRISLPKMGDTQNLGANFLNFSVWPFSSFDKTSSF